MSENLRLFTTAVFGLDAVVRRVPDDAWDQPAPCEGWTTRQVAGHITWGLLMTAEAAGGPAAPQGMSEAEVAGDDPARMFVAGRDLVLESLDHEGVLHQEAATPFGQMPIDKFLRIFAVDPLLHTWDIATGAGVDPAIDTDLAALYHSRLERSGDAIRGPGMFGPAVEVADDADIVSKLVAIAGRDPG